MSTADNGGLLRRLPLFSKLDFISSYTGHFQVPLRNFLWNLLLISPIR